MMQTLERFIIAMTKKDAATIRARGLCEDELLFPEKKKLSRMVNDE